MTTESIDFLSELNPSQRRAAKHFCGPLLVVAGAGSGKTRALTYRIANLIRNEGVEPEHILAVTFTNKAAREMKERIERVFAEERSQQKMEKPLAALEPEEQVRVRSQVWKAYIKPLWIGTFHSLCARILRFDIDKYKDESGRMWERNFSIFDESDVMDLMKEIVKTKLNLDDKKFEPRKVRYQISAAKNKGWSPDDLEANEPGYRGRTLARVYREYQNGLAANNGLDFDDLIRVPVELFRQNKEVLDYWHRQFHHILVDEYQDTNRTQYDLLRLLATNGRNTREAENWENRSIFVVGDIDQCQPEGSTVLTTEGYLPIERLDPERHRLASYDRQQLAIASRKEGYGFDKADRSYNGRLIVVRAGDKQASTTPNHLWPIRWTPLAKNQIYVTYLMRQGDLYRVGSCKLFENGLFNLGQEATKYKARGTWILVANREGNSAFKNEAKIASVYGIPREPFELIKPENRANPERAEECLQYFGRIPKYPLYSKKNAMKLSGRASIIEVAAANLIPGLMAVGVMQEQKQEVSWEEMTLQYEEYSGLVYSLDVDRHQVYFTNGLLTHNSIYSFRMADFTILMEFQEDFGDRLSDEDTQTMVKLEENYRSRENILEVANQLIANNSERIDKVLRATRGQGEPIYCHRAYDEVEEAEFVVEQISRIEASNPEIDWNQFAILYRTNAQSRSFEDKLIMADIPYRVVGGLRFYDRREVKDMLAYLRAIANPADNISLKRIINTPRRNIGKTTIERIENVATELGVPLWEIIGDTTSINTVAGRSAKAVIKFAEMMAGWQEQIGELTAAEILDGLMEDSGYLEALKNEGTEEADNRLANLQQLYNAIVQYGEDNEDSSLMAFLENASLASDLDSLGDGDAAVSLMTLHSAKGLEFPVVFVVGMQEGLFPHFRSLDDPRAMEEERRLCYVGITRAEEQLFLTHATQRRLWGSSETSRPSRFFKELPVELLEGNAVPKRRKIAKKSSSQKSNSVVSEVASAAIWTIGDRALHDDFGEGKVTHVFGQGKKMTVAVKFSRGGAKIIDPKTTNLQKLE